MVIMPRMLSSKNGEGRASVVSAPRLAELVDALLGAMLASCALMTMH